MPRFIARRALLIASAILPMLALAQTDAEPKLPAIRPKQNMVIACSTPKVQIDSTPAIATPAWTAPMTMKAIRAVCEISREPSRPTRRAFNREATAMPPAMAANTRGKTDGA